MKSDNKKASLLTLEPSDSIVFEGPFDDKVSKSLIIGNPSKTQRVAFKLKTTTIRMFLVRPNVGTIGPDSKVTVDIFVQPITEDAGQKPIKFLVQAALVSGNEIDLHEFWKEQKPEDIWEAKIMCALDQPKPSEEQLRHAGGANSAIDPKAEGKIDFDAQEVSESEAQLLKQVSILEEERIVLKEEISILQDRTVVHYTKPLDMEFFIIGCCILTILAAIVGAYCGKQYL